MNDETMSAAAVPMKIERVFDSCSDKDCITNLQVVFDEGAALPPQFLTVKTRCVTIDHVCLSVEPIPFNRGYFSVDVTYHFGIELLAYARSCDNPTVLHGTASASKSVILYGSESSTKTFFSNAAPIGETNFCCETQNLPTASCQCVDPIALETRVAMMPASQEMTDTGCGLQRTVVLTLGVFSIIELSRPVTVNGAIYPYNAPQKRCAAEQDSPCEIFNRLSFPADAFTPSLDETPMESTDLHYEGFTGLT